MMNGSRKCISRYLLPCNLPWTLVVYRDKNNLTVSVGQDSGSGLDGWFWHNISYERGLRSSEAWLGLSDPLPGRLTYNAIVGWLQLFLWGCLHKAAWVSLWHGRSLPLKDEIWNMHSHTHTDAQRGREKETMFSWPILRSHMLSPLLRSILHANQPWWNCTRGLHTNVGTQRVIGAALEAGYHTFHNLKIIVPCSFIQDSYSLKPSLWKENKDT